MTCFLKDTLLEIQWDLAVCKKKNSVNQKQLIFVIGNWVGEELIAFSEKQRNSSQTPGGTA